MRTLTLLAAFGLAALLMLYGQPQDKSNFSGKATRQEPPQVRAARIHFEAARTKWHTHERGQVLLCEDGVSRTQVQGRSVQELHPGETTYVPGGVPHWHGASPIERRHCSPWT